MAVTTPKPASAADKKANSFAERYVFYPRGRKSTRQLTEGHRPAMPTRTVCSVRHRIAATATAPRPGLD
jgi:hypothetical protein